MRGESKFLIYRTDDEKVEVDVRFEEETVWLTQQQIAELFRTSKQLISHHLKNIFDEQELNKNAVVKYYLTTAADGKNYKTSFYSLDAIISLGYRINSKVATSFRQWATKRLNEYIRKGWTMDDERLKELGGGGYFKELLDRIRDIRASEKVFYRQILDIYAMSVDYDPKAKVSVDFFKKVQNKIHFAVHGQTAAEVIYNRADAEKEFMGLTTFKGDKPSLKEVEIAKNYLNEKELKDMNMLVSGYLDFAERKAEREEYMRMEDWAKYLDDVLTMNGDKLLRGGGSVSHDEAIHKAHVEYKKYQAKTLSSVERDFLETIRKIERRFGEE